MIATFASRKTQLRRAAAQRRRRAAAETVAAPTVECVFSCSKEEHELAILFHSSHQTVRAMIRTMDEGGMFDAALALVRAPERESAEKIVSFIRDAVAARHGRDMLTDPRRPAATEWWGRLYMPTPEWTWLSRVYEVVKRVSPPGNLYNHQAAARDAHILARLVQERGGAVELRDAILPHWNQCKVGAAFL